MGEQKNREEGWEEGRKHPYIDLLARSTTTAHIHTPPHPHHASIPMAHGHASYTPLQI